ncbi:phospholipase effector Tle1 domain-containing protein, partial [Acinetobacter boissieri]
GAYEYFLDRNNNLVQVVYPNGERLKYAYQGKLPHQLTSKWRLDSNRQQWQLETRWSYDQWNRAIVSEQADHVNYVKIDFDAKITPATQVSMATKNYIYKNTLTNSLGIKTTYQYEIDGTQFRLLEVKGAGCSSCGEVNKRYRYTKEGWISEISQLADDGNILSTVLISYDSLGQIKSKTLTGENIDSQTIYYEYQNGKMIHEYRKSIYEGHKYHKYYKYDSNGQLLSMNEYGFSVQGEPIQKTVRYGYDQKGRVLFEDRQPVDKFYNKNNITIYHYNDKNWISAWENPFLHQKTTINYDDLGRVIQYTKYDDVNTVKEITRLSYSQSTQISEIELELPSKQEKYLLKYKYNSLGQLMGRYDKNNNIIQEYSYDNAGRIIGDVNAKNGLSIYSLNTENQYKSIQTLSPQGDYKQIGYMYDEFGRLIRVADSLKGDILDMQYIGQQKIVTNQVSGLSYIFGYDGLNQLISQWRIPMVGKGLLSPDLTILSNTYKQRSIRLDDGTITKQDLDDFGRVNIERSTIQGDTQYRYTQRDQTLEIKKGEQRTQFEYDELGRLIRKKLLIGDQTFDDIKYVYAKAQLICIESKYQRQEFEYDTHARMTLSRTWLDQLKQPIITRYEYDKDGHPKTLSLADGTEISTDHHRLTYKLPHHFFSKTLIEKNQTQDNQTYYVFGNKVHLDFLYSARSEWKGLNYHLNNEDLLSQTWDFDYLHRIRSVMTQGILKDTRQYLYDENNHVILNANMDNSLREAFFYDSLGNRLISEDFVKKQRQANKYKDGYLTAKQLDNIEYNHIGEAISYPMQQGNLHFEYKHGLLSRVWHNKQLVANYFYNHLGQRVKKCVYESVKDGLCTYYYYHANQLAAELNQSGNITKQYIYTGQRLLAVMDYIHPTALANTERLNVFERLIHSDEVNVLYAVNDYMGRPRLLTNDQGQVVWKDKSPDLFGAAEIESQNIELNLRFIGQYFDGETGLYYNGYRYYDPTTGRYISPDPLGLKGGENQYGYVNQQPNQFFDPQGLLLFAFDGTGNTDNNPADRHFLNSAGDDNRESNVVRFRNAYDGSVDQKSTGIDIAHTQWAGQNKTFSQNVTGNHFEGFYISGAGTTDQYTGLKSIYNDLDAGIGETLPQRVNQMLIYFSQYMQKVVEHQNITKDKNGYKEISIPIDVVGFSRGAASARMFASKLDYLLKQDYKYGGDPVLAGSLTKYWGQLNKEKLKCLGININYNFLGIWDTVPSLGINIENDVRESNDIHASISVSDKFAYVAHAVAVNEHRENFMARSIYTSIADAKANDTSKYNIENKAKNHQQVKIERGFMGAHSDIGGGYSEGDLNKVPLMWMIDQAKNVGVKFNQGVIDNKKYNKVMDPVVHDSVGDIKAGLGRSPGLALMQPGREFRWSGASNDGDAKNNNQHNTFAHLGLNWKDTLQFQAKGKSKFEKGQELEQAYQKAWGRCHKFGVVCDELRQLQELKSLGLNPETGKPYTDEKSDPRTVLYRTDNKSNEKIQIKSYLDWINNHYGTTLTYQGK